MQGKRKAGLIIALFLVSLALAACGMQPQAAPPKADEGYKQILMSSTIGPIDAGIVGVLEAEFQKKTGIVVRHVGAGTGAALKLAESGNFDVVLVHAKALEEKFVADGFGTKRYDLMYNDFVLLGPAEDPAKVKGEKSISIALQKIMDSKALFITRGDKSGTVSVSAMTAPFSVNANGRTGENLNSRRWSQFATTSFFSSGVNP